MVTATLPAGAATEQPTLLPFFTPTPPNGAFDLALAAALEGRDFDSLRGMMGETFAVATFNRSLLATPADEALQGLREAILADGAQPVVMWGTDLFALLSGADPLGQWGPVAEPVRAMHVVGLGPGAHGEALFVIARDADAAHYWHGVLLPENGQTFAPPTNPTGFVLPTGVTALQDVPLYEGPGADHPSAGRMRAGETGQVTGRSADGAWWEIACTSTAARRCWVTTDPTQMQPVD
jgi:hypothetical protein